MAEEKTNDQLTAITEAIATLSPETQALLYEPLKKLNSKLNQKHRVIGLIQSAIQQLRLDVKYLIFDLEATRRERDEYKQQLGK
jgi:chromosome segregation ATPase